MRPAVVLTLTLSMLTGCQCGPGGQDGGMDAGSDGGTEQGACAQGQLFESCHPWTTDVSGLNPHPESDAIIGALGAAGGWGSGNFRTERSLVVLDAPAGTTFRSFTPTSNFYTPDCDSVPFPVPAGGAIEGESGYACTGGGDCHLLVIDRPGKRLYEMWKASITGASTSEFQGGCAVVWDLTRQYGSTLRGRGCSSADGAGFPISAMLASADEVYSGEVKHALRFTLPNARIRNGIYVPPATHSTFPTSGGPNLPPYGVRFRLKKTFNVNSLTAPGARTIAIALQRYGMFLADGGNIPLTIASDRFTTHKWSEVGITNDLALASIQVADFEVVDMGTPVNWKADTDCYRNP
jgi:serine/threonine-protein kinase